jgi:beta-lactamase regulating signal transducer with metallopeptidase domain/Flp pilus assembly protein TadD
MLDWALENTLTAAALAAVNAAACRPLRRRPAVCHLLWLLGLLCLLAPPLPLPGWTALRPAVRSFWEARAAQPEPEAQTLQAPLPAAPAPAKPVLAEAARTGPDTPHAGSLPQPKAGRSKGQKPGKSAAGKAGLRKDPVRAAARREAKKAAADARAAASADPAGPSERRSPAAASGPAPAAAPASRTASAAEAASMQWPSLQSWLLGLWLAGSGLVLGVLLRRILRFQAVVRKAAPAPAEVVAAVGQMAARLGLRPPRIRLLPGLSAPAVWSLPRPVLLWPASVAGQPLPCTPAVVAHELAHLRRRDHRVSGLELAGRVLFWWNPVLWLLRRRIGHYAELACDAWALWAVPGGPKSYAESLLSALARPAEPHPAAPGLHAIAADRKSLERRLCMIMRHRLSPRIPPLAALAAFALTLPVLPTLSREAPEPHLAPAELPDLGIDPELDPILRAEIQRVRGERYHASEHWDLAATALQEAAAADPQDGKLQAKLGYALVRAGRPAEAVPVFQRQAELGHRVATATFNLGCARALQGQPEAALEHLEAALRAGFHDTEMLMDPDLASLKERPELQRLAMRMLAFEKLVQDTKQGRSARDPEAVEGLRRILETAPDWGWAHLRLGKALLGLGRIEEARTSFSRALELRHEPADSHLALARLEARAGNLEPALTHLEAAVDLDRWKHGRKHKHKHKNKHKDKHDWQDEHAEDELFEDGEELDALRGEPRYQKLVRRLSGWERFEEALEEAEHDRDAKAARAALEAYLAEAPAVRDKRGRAQEAFGHALLEMRKFPEALEAFREQLRMRYEAWHALRHMADAYAQLGELERAFRCLEAAVRLGVGQKDSLSKDEHGLLRPLKADPRFRSLVHAAADAEILEMFGAVDWRHLDSIAHRQLGKDPESGGGQLKLGWARLRLGDPDGAIAAFRRQEELGYREQIAWYNLACSYARKGDRDQAFAWFEKAVDSGLERLTLFEEDPDLDGLRGDPRFEELMQELRRGRKK